MNCSKFVATFRGFLPMAILVASVTACVKPSPRAVDPNNQFTDQATFVNDEVTGEAVTSKNVSDLSIGAEKLFNFKTCLKDKRTEQSIKGHKFNIVGATGEVVMIGDGRSDDVGCVRWSEKVKYNGLSEPKYVSLKRNLVAVGVMHTGARDLKICINPWESGKSAVIDCGKNAVPESQMATATESESILNGSSGDTAGAKGARLWVDQVRISAIQDPGGSDGALMDLSVSMVPKISTKNIRGETVPMTLSDGTFDVNFWIVAKTGGEGVGKCLILAKTEFAKPISMKDAILRTERKMRVRYMISYGQLEMVGVITPKNHTVSPFNGLWLLGDHTQLLGMKFGVERKESFESDNFNAKKYAEDCTDVSGKLALELPPRASDIPPPTPAEKAIADKTVAKYTNGSEGAMSIPQFLQDRAAMKASIPHDLLVSECVRPEDIPRLFPLDEAAQNFKAANDVITCDNQQLPGAVYKLEQFEFDNVLVRAEPIADPINGETTTERTVKYVVTTTVRNPLSPSVPLRDLVFNIKKSNGTVVSRRTNAQGQLIFNDEIKHIYFHPERYMLKIVEISHASGFKRRLPIVLNPWDNNGWTFGRDIRILQSSDIAQVNLIPRPTSELLLTQFQWGTQGFNYKVDNSLNLVMFKDFNITLNPRVLRYSSLTEGRMKNEALRDGIYIMKVAIQKDYKPLNDGPQEYITAVKKLVRVANGIINTPVTMEFRDFRVLKIRSNMMVEIQTIDERKLSQLQRKTLNYEGAIDSLIIKNSGLEARTFVGPVVAYSNGFSASMRPTDDLSEAICGTIDCDEVKRDEARHTAKIMCAHAQDKDEVCKLHNFTDKEAREIKLKRCAYEGDKSIACSSLGLTNIADEEIARDLKEIEIERKSAELFDSYGGYPQIWREQAAILSKAKKDSTPDNAKAAKEIADQKKKFRGDITHLLNKTVGDMLARQEVLRGQNERKVRESADLARVLAMGNFEYGALANEPLIVSRNAGVKKNNQVLSQNGNAFVDLLQRMSTYNLHEKFYDRGLERVYSQLAPTPVPNMNELRTTLFEGGNLTTDVAARLCIFFVEDMILRRNEKTEASLGYLDGKKAAFMRKRVNDECMKELMGTIGQKPGFQMGQMFNVEHMLRVFRVEKSESNGGNLLSFNRGAGLSVGQSTSESFSYSWTPLGVLKVIPFIKDVYDAVGWSISKSYSDSTSLSDGSSAGETTSLAVELTGMNLEIAEHERCTAIRMNIPLLEKLYPYLNGAFPANLSAMERADRVSRGVLLCEGVLRRQPTSIDERFYMFSQGIGEEVANDPVAIENHPYLKSVRGRTNYVEFITALTNQPAKISKRPYQPQLGEFSAEELKKVFNSPTPNLPGILRMDANMVRQMRGQK